MDTTKVLQTLKQEPGFNDNVGMILVHNGVVRGWSRANHAKVTTVRVTPDHARIQTICQELEKQTGIFRILAEAAEGLCKPGDDLLFLVVAGDIREHVKDTFALLLDRIKNEAVIKEENLE